MSSKKPFSELQLVAQVRRALPIAKSVVVLGFSDVSRCETDRECLPIRVEEIVGHGGPDLADDKNTSEQFDDYLYAAYALGIAIGQLVSPRLFEKDGCAMNAVIPFERRTGANVTLKVTPEELLHLQDAIDDSIGWTDLRVIPMSLRLLQVRLHTLSGEEMPPARKAGE